MQPIFKEMIDFWQDKGFALPIQEGIYWLNRGIIKAFTSDGELHNIWKYSVDKDLNVTIKPHRDYKKSRGLTFETWQETYDRLKSHIDDLENQSLQEIKNAITNYPNHHFFALTSTGKDSTLTLHIIQKILPDIPIIFNNTSLDCVDTYRIVKNHKDWIVTNPQKGFYQWILDSNFIPTRFSRTCCRIFKEEASTKWLTNNVGDNVMHVMGVRSCESVARADREFISRNPKWENPTWCALYPIVLWEDLDVWLYTLANNLEINSKYKKGYSRVGCAIACPYYSERTWVLDEYWYHGLYTRWHNILENDFLQNQRWQQLNCTLKEYHTHWCGGLVRETPNDDVVDEMMKYKGLTDRNTALQFFNKSCCECGKSIRSKDVMAMNLKLFGRNTNKFYCKKCMMKKFNWHLPDWNERVQYFKNDGCDLF